MNTHVPHIEDTLNATPASWNDFNTAGDQSEFNLIPSGTLAKVRLIIRPGGYSDQSQGWTAGYATKNQDTGVVYLGCEFIIMEGQYIRRKIWSNIGLFSPKTEEYALIGRAFIKGILNSARRLKPKDLSPEAQAARRISGLGELDGTIFIARISVRKDQQGNLRNEINLAITPDHKDYAALMNENSNPTAGGNINDSPISNLPAVPADRPSWAQ